jgi:ComF family protein
MKDLLRGILDLVLPPVCLACDGLIATGDTKRLVCRRCRSLLRPAPPPLCSRCGAPRLRTGRETEPGSCDECAQWPGELRTARSAYLMHPPADRIVHQLKYRGWGALADVMAEPMTRVMQSSDVAEQITAIMPVPTTSSRLRERGYNQAELIARAVARTLDRECEQLLERTASRTTQTTLQPAARGANVAGAFRLRSNAQKRARDAHILIVDDVLTTGATAIECTRTLVAAGARCTSVLTYARALDTRRLLG